MARTNDRLSLGLAMIVVGACAGVSDRELIFVDGRGVAAVGDSLSAFTRQGTPGIVIHDRRSGALYRRAVNLLHSPVQIQFADGRWYVSDVDNGDSRIRVFDAEWRLLRELPTGPVASAPHQFAVLPDGRIVLEAADGRLIALRGDSITTFAVTPKSQQTGFLVAAQGGVLHVVPGETVTLYNAIGNWRWRLEWPWHEEAYVSDVTVDSRGRIHLLLGEERTQPQFVAFTLSPLTGEVVRWSLPAPSATFVATQLGNLEPDTTITAREPPEPIVGPPSAPPGG